MNKSETSTFAFTYKKNYKKNEQMYDSDYDIVLNHIRSYGILTNHFFERTGKNTQLHIHGTALLPKKVRYTTLVIKGYHSKWEEIYDLVGWTRYIKKDQKLNEHVNFLTRTNMMEIEYHEQHRDDDEFNYPSPPYSPIKKRLV